MINRNILFPLGALAVALSAKALAAPDDTDRKIAEFKSPTYYLMEQKQVDLKDFKKDKRGYYVIFDGTSFDGWRGFGRDTVPGRWVLDNGAMHFIGNKSAKPTDGDGGDLLFSHKFKNFELEFEWMVGENSNSGVFYLVQETMTPNGGDRNLFLQYAAASAPEYQILDNFGHPDAKLGVDGNRQSASLYDLIPAKPQNGKPHGEWNTAKIVVRDGKVSHWQNGVEVLSYELWTPEWVRMLAESKFGPGEWDIAFELMRNAGGENHEGYITLQDHGDDVWYRNFRIKELK